MAGVCSRSPLSWELAVEHHACRFSAHTGNRGVSGRRSAIGAWSQSSRRRFVWAAHRLDWGHRPPWMVTLTWQRVEQDGIAAKQALRRFRERFCRMYGPVRGLWKLEFQRRGAIHFHLVLCAYWRPTKQDVRFVAEAWHAVCGETSDAHLAAGTCLEEWSSGPDSVSYYLLKYLGSSKFYQTELPVGLRGIGRWWGIWGCPRMRSPLVVPVAEGVIARRTIRRMVQAAARERGRLVRSGCTSCRGGAWVGGRRVLAVQSIVHWALRGGGRPGPALAGGRPRGLSSCIISARDSRSGFDLPGLGCPF